MAALNSFSLLRASTVRALGTIKASRIGHSHAQTHRPFHLPIQFRRAISRVSASNDEKASAREAAATADTGAPTMLIVKCALNYIFLEPRSCKHDFIGRTKKSNDEHNEKCKRDSLFIDKRGKLRSFNYKKVSRERGGSLRGKGWKYGSGFVDGIFPVLSPIAQQILNFVQKEVDANRIWSSLDTLPPTLTTWDDVITVAVQLRLNKRWDSIILICEWILYRSSFHPDVICYNLLIDAYGRKSQHDKAESTYLDLLEGRCIPTEDTYALLVRAYCTSGLLEKAEAVFAEMRKNGHPPSMSHILWSHMKGTVSNHYTQIRHLDPLIVTIFEEEVLIRQ